MFVVVVVFVFLCVTEWMSVKCMWWFVAVHCDRVVVLPHYLHLFRFPPFLYFLLFYFLNVVLFSLFM